MNGYAPNFTQLLGSWT